MIANCIHFSITTSKWSLQVSWYLFITTKKKKLAQQNCTNQANPLMILFKNIISILPFSAEVSPDDFSPSMVPFINHPLWKKQNKQKKNYKKTKNTHLSVVYCIFLNCLIWSWAQTLTITTHSVICYCSSLSG